jgi:hypothetical protein
MVANRSPARAIQLIAIQLYRINPNLKSQIIRLLQVRFKNQRLSTIGNSKQLIRHNRNSIIPMLRN